MLLYIIIVLTVIFLNSGCRVLHGDFNPGEKKEIVSKVEFADTSKQYSREEVIAIVQKAIERGREEGRKSAILNLIEEINKEELKKLEESVMNIEGVCSQNSFLGKIQLEENKAKAMTSYEYLKLINSRCKEVGLRLQILTTIEGIQLIDQFSQMKILMNLSPEFSANIIDNFSRMTLAEALALLCKLYGFDLWGGDDGKTLYLIYPMDKPVGVKIKKISVEFNEGKYMKRLHL